MNRALVSCCILVAAMATMNATAQSSGTAGAASSTAATFKPEELEQIVAPIALYPDSLLAQIFMASTYPLEIVQAARWSKAHPDVKGDAVAGAVQKETWDASVKSLVAFPDVLTMMNEKIDWTQKLGDAFLADQAGVMGAVQRLRAKAKDAGNLKSTKEMTVSTEPAPAGSATPQIIVIESSDPEVIYVPTYNPTVAYGYWPYPAYPPYYYYPPGYVAGAAFWSFSVGFFVGGAIWGDCNWGGNDIDIDIDRENNFNRNEINHNRDGNRDGNRDRVNQRDSNRAGNNRSGNKSTWQHNSDHRKGVGYRDSATQQKYGRGSSQQAIQSREQFRARAEQGRQQISREGVGNQRDMSGNRIGSGDSSRLGQSPSRDLANAQNRAGTNQHRDLGGTQSRSDRSMGSSPSRDFSGSRGGSQSRSSATFSGMGNGAGTRASSSRGSMSRSSAGMSRGGGGRRR